ncbi:hypothetical protein B0H19DRAFT_1277713 [Mycena capillaripes]|nr:hypothetical protein B0H19DRAFT_1277713 [Mycena capillaripes]
MSPASPTRAAFIPFMYKVPVPKEQRDDLVAALDAWQTTKQAQRAGGPTVTPDLICKLVPWDLASQEDLKAVAMIIKDWRFDAQRAIGLTPRGGHRAKQQNTMPNPRMLRAVHHWAMRRKSSSLPSRPLVCTAVDPGGVGDAVAELRSHHELPMQTSSRRPHLCPTNDGYAHHLFLCPPHPIRLSLYLAIPI